MSSVKKRIEYILKHNTFVQYMYKQCFSFILRIIGLFVSTDDNLILFNSFGGRKYNDSPKVLFEAMVNDPRYSDYRFVWAFEEPEKFKIEKANCIKIDSIQYFLTALKAKVWISSVNIERGLHFKKKNTFYINTWHGAGTKKIGNACSGRKDYNFTSVNMMLVQSPFEREIFIRDFQCDPKAIRMIGFPRNDELFHISIEDKEKLRHKYNIPDNKKVILYAPTWRDSKDGGVSYEFVPPIHIEKWKEKLSDEYIMLFRMHTFTNKFVMDYDDFARNGSLYDDLNQILAISDVLITDYSTIVYDASIADLPFICFGFDYDTYSQERGFYFDLNHVYPGGVLKREDEVIQKIPRLIHGEEREKYRAFKEQYIKAGGSATHQILNELSEILRCNKS